MSRSWSELEGWRKRGLVSVMLAMLSAAPTGVGVAALLLPAANLPGGQTLAVTLIVLGVIGGGVSTALQQGWIGKEFFGYTRGDD